MWDRLTVLVQVNLWMTSSYTRWCDNFETSFESLNVSKIWAGLMGAVCVSAVLRVLAYYSTVYQHACSWCAHT